MGEQLHLLELYFPHYKYEPLWGREGFWRGNLRERDHLEDPGLDGRIILRWIFRKWDGKCGLV
jgi:hypothetical protein